MAQFTIALDEVEKKVLLDLLRNYGADTDDAGVCRHLFLKIQTTEPVLSD